MRSLVAAGAVMIYPKSFCANPDTLASNSFQSKAHDKNNEILQMSQKEFLEFQKKLTDNGIKILQFEELTVNFTPDALFPNNWFCQLPDGRVFLFPMFPENRRHEFRTDVIESLKATEIVDLRHLEKENLFLEGTGSLIFDHGSKTAFACLSPRTSEAALEKFAELSGYRVISFHSVASGEMPVYHTNVMMALSLKNVVICLSSIKDRSERLKVTASLAALGRNIVDISYEEMNSFAGNMLFIRNEKENFWVCSEQAYKSLSDSNRKALEAEARFLYSKLDTIEKYGGGGARCLLAEIF